MDIRFERKIDALSKEEWHFVQLNDNWVLQRFTLWKKKTSRHKFRPVKTYYRLDSRECNLNVDEIKITGEIEKRVVSEITKRIKVEK